MQKLIPLSLLLILALAGPRPAHSQEPFQPAQPTDSHKWLQQLIGDWETTARTEPAPGQPAFECQGKESTRAIGALWVVSQGEAASMGIAVESLFTLGYDPRTEKFVGTWVDSMFNHMWQYEGSLDESGRVLTLLTKGPSFTNPEATASYKEVLELKDADHKVFTSYMQLDNGEWLKLVTVTGTRTR